MSSELDSPQSPKAIYSTTLFLIPEDMGGFSPVTKLDFFLLQFQTNTPFPNPLQ